MPNRPARLSLSQAFFGFGLALMTVVVLSAGKPVLMPIALSMLIAFVLAPLVQVLENWKLGRIPSVVIASCIAFFFIGFASWALAGQLNKLAKDLPNHEHEIKDKLASLRMSEDSTLGRLNHMLKNLFSGAENSDTSVKDPGVSDADSAAKSTVILKQEDTPIVSTVDALLPIVEPIATAAFVVVLVLFLLIRREDIRYRTISLLGESALTGTTRLLQDTAARVSNYLFHLLLVNAVFGLWFAIGLYFLKVPYPPLWGVLTVFLRFIPFLGSPASVVFPLLISIATSTGWWQPLAVLVFFSISELVTANIIEPILFGKSTGLTPIALLIAALFWAWLWGPIGLLLSTPLTVCLVVLGQHLPALRSLKVLLAEQPILDPKLQLFQRLLTKDLMESERLIAGYSAATSVESTVDDVMIPALKWTRKERQTESITADEERFIYSSLPGLLELPSAVGAPPRALADAAPNAVADTGKADTGKADTGKADTGKTVVEARPREETDSLPIGDIASPALSVVGYPVHHESEEVALALLKRLSPLDCEFQLLSTKLLPSQVISQLRECRPEVAVLAVLPPGGLSQLQFICTEMQAACPTTKIVVAHFGTIQNYDRLLVRMRKKGVTYLTTSVAQTNQLLAVLVEQRREEKRKLELGRSSLPPPPHLGLSTHPRNRSILGDEVTHVG